ncbi:hypothetical protein N7454_002797 [Penicillium verhagenii]|nr:hypothetical protein N7454_002797 [Penicillium verhagenii]
MNDEETGLRSTDKRATISHSHRLHSAHHRLTAPEQLESSRCFAPEALALLLAASLTKADDVTATVNLALSKGSPIHWAAGFIYGIPDTADFIPDHWYTDMGFNYGRAGGAQLDAPDRGWIWGLTEYKGRLKSTLSNYNTCRKYGADFILLPHDIWGTDHANSSTVWPGDDGDWTSYDLFLKTLMADLKANDALEGDADFNHVLISGPTLAGSPVNTNTWWTNWLAQVAGNKTIPDQYAYHLEGTSTDSTDDLQNSNVSLSAMLKTYDLPSRQVNINEYGNFGEQIPAGAAWWISRLERYDAFGLRGNWQSSCTLHDLFANLLTKTTDPTTCTETGYVSAPEYQVYKYYNLNMTGERVNTTGSADRLMDVYATVDSDTVRILCGVRITEGTWQITVDNMSAVGLPTAGTVDIQTWGFAGTDVWEEVDAPSNRGIVSHTYTGNTLSFPIYQTDASTAWAFEFAR